MPIINQNTIGQVYDPNTGKYKPYPDPKAERVSALDIPDRSGDWSMLHQNNLAEYDRVFIKLSSILGLGSVSLAELVQEGSSVHFINLARLGSMGKMVVRITQERDIAQEALKNAPMSFKDPNPFKLENLDAPIDPDIIEKNWDSIFNF